MRRFPSCSSKSPVGSPLRRACSRRARTRYRSPPSTRPSPPSLRSHSRSRWNSSPRQPQATHLTLVQLGGKPLARAVPGCLLPTSPSRWQTLLVCPTRARAPCLAALSRSAFTTFRQSLHIARRQAGSRCGAQSPPTGAGRRVPQIATCAQQWCSRHQLAHRPTRSRRLEVLVPLASRHQCRTNALVCMQTRSIMARSPTR